MYLDGSNVSWDRSYPSNLSLRYAEILELSVKQREQNRARKVMYWHIHPTCQQPTCEKNRRLLKDFHQFFMLIDNFIFPYRCRNWNAQVLHQCFHQMLIYIRNHNSLQSGIDLLVLGKFSHNYFVYSNVWTRWRTISVSMRGLIWNLFLYLRGNERIITKANSSVWRNYLLWQYWHYMAVHGWEIFCVLGNRWRIFIQPLKYQAL